ncbi:MAG: BrnT family toxin [Magnetococcus sp. YQC-5]
MLSYIFVTTLCDMKLIYDPTKDACNQEKHGLSLQEAIHLNWDNALIWKDTRHDYGEVRQVALATLGNRVHVVVFVDLPHGRRIISLRKANAREVTRYVNS